METKHTPEPWRVEYKNTGSYIFSKEPNLLLLSMSHTQSTMTCNHNASRIVECVNAMAGIDDPMEHRAFFDSIQHLELDAYAKMKTERDDLIAVLTNIDAILESGSTITPKSLIRGAVCIALGKDPSVIM